MENLGVSTTIDPTRQQLTFKSADGLQARMVLTVGARPVDHDESLSSEEKEQSGLTGYERFLHELTMSRNALTDAERLALVANDAYTAAVSSGVAVEAAQLDLAASYKDAERFKAQHANLLRGAEAAREAALSGVRKLLSERATERHAAATERLDNVLSAIAKSVADHLPQLADARAEWSRPSHPNMEKLVPPLPVEPQEEPEPALGDFHELRT